MTGEVDRWMKTRKRDMESVCITRNKTDAGTNYVMIFTVILKIVKFSYFSLLISAFLLIRTVGITNS